MLLLNVYYSILNHIGMYEILGYNGFLIYFEGFISILIVIRDLSMFSRGRARMLRRVKNLLMRRADCMLLWQFVRIILIILFD